MYKFHPQVLTHAHTHAHLKQNKTNKKAFPFAGSQQRGRIKLKARLKGREASALPDNQGADDTFGAPEGGSGEQGRMLLAGRVFEAKATCTQPDWKESPH